MAEKREPVNGHFSAKANAVGYINAAAEGKGSDERVGSLSGVAAKAEPRFSSDIYSGTVGGQWEPTPLGGSTGAHETLYIFELKGRKDLDMGKKIGLPLFDETIPIVRTYTWNANKELSGPGVEEIRANNTMTAPWPTGNALLYRNGEFVSSITMPYT